MKFKKKIFFVPNNVTGVVFWRMYQFFLKMKQKGVDAFMLDFDFNTNVCGKWENLVANNTEAREKVYNRFLHCDIAIMEYIKTPIALAMLEMFKERFDKKFLMEIDDNVLNTPTYNEGYGNGYYPGSQLTKVALEQAKLSNGIITSTGNLESVYGLYNENTNVIPNCIDFDIWDKYKARPKFKKLRIGWIGAAGHGGDLEILKTVIPEITKRYKNVEFVLVHGATNEFKKMKGVKVIKTWTTMDKYPEVMASYGFDIGIAPLQFNKFNMSKSNLRWLEYSALKIPTVATDIEPFSKSIKHGSNGFLVKEASQWVMALATLIESKKGRKEMGCNAYETIRKSYNLDKITDKYIKVLKEL